MPLFQRREEERKRADQVARGEAVPLTTEFSFVARNQLLYAVVDNTPTFTVGDDERAFLRLIHRILTREWGVLSLAGENDPPQDVRVLIAVKGKTQQLLDVIEAVFLAFREVWRMNRSALGREVTNFRERVNEIMDNHDLAYQVVRAEVVPRESMITHAEVVAPALSLLHGDARFEKVEKAFQDALSELKPDGNPADAITDAGTALQEMLTVLGAEGNALGPLLASARKRDLLGPHDSKLAEGVEKIGHWVSAERSTRGDAHKVTDADRDDAWLAVHVVGALILRLEKRA